MLFPDKQALPGEELLRLARSSIEYGLAHGKPLPVEFDQLPATLAEPGATFTTLHLEGDLRGCCGILEAVSPLAVDVTQSAFRAAFEDARFAPLREHELDALHVGVSVLSPLEAMPVRSQQDLLDQLVPGETGLVIIAHGRRATFLPSVWGQLPNPSEFVAALKMKCGLKRDYWSDGLGFMRYTTTSYSEPV